MYIYIYVSVYIILSVIVFSSLSFYGERTIPGTKRQPAILNLIDGVFNFLKWFSHIPSGK